MAILGNHDHSRKLKVLRQALAQSNIQNLGKSSLDQLSEKEKKLAIAGLDDPYWGNPDLPQVLSLSYPNATPSNIFSSRTRLH